MKRSDAALLVRALGRVLRAQFAKRDAQIEQLQQRAAELERQLADLRKPA